MNRFERQIKLEGFGNIGQQKLRDAKVLVVGAGGLGCPALLYLAAAGIGTIAIADGDSVSISNLNRQIIFSERDVNKLKAEVAANYLKEKYNDLHIETINAFLTNENSLQIITKYDLIIDGSDNFETRYLINDACVLLHKPLVFGAIFQNEGQVAVFNVSRKNITSTNYRDVFPDPPLPEEIPDCNITGVLGVLPGIIGVMMASEAIKLLSGFGKPLINKLLFYNLITNSFYETEILPNINATVTAPITFEEFTSTNYNLQCKLVATISWSEALTMKNQSQNNVLLVDIRELHEQPRLDDIEYTNIPMQELFNSTEELSKAENIVVFCQSGIRSVKAAKALADTFPHKSIFSINGGISHYKKTATNK